MHVFMSSRLHVFIFGKASAGTGASPHLLLLPSVVVMLFAERRAKKSCQRTFIPLQAVQAHGR